MTRQNHLYLLDTRILRDKEIYEQQYVRMSPARREKIDKFRFDKDKRLSLGAGILLLKALEDFESSGGESVTLSYGDYGKPYIDGREDFHFNLSHSGYVAACAISSGPVGVDIEGVRDFEDNLIRYVFNDSEILYIKEHCPDTNAAFTRLWTIKESVMKYFGSGMSLPPRDILVDMKEEVRVRCDRYDCRYLHFTGCMPEGYHVTVCSELETFSDGPEWVDVEHLL